MDRLSLFKAAMQAGLYKSKAWVISAFTIINEGDDEYKKNPYPYRIVQNKTYMGYVDPDTKEVIPISDAKPNEPIYTFKDRIDVDNTICANATTPVNTNLGNLLFNLIVLVNAFNDKIPFITGKVNIGKIESQIAKRLESTPAPDAIRDPRFIYIDEYSRFVDSLQYLNNFSYMTVWAITEKNSVSAPGIAEFKQTLIKKYGDTLSDSAQMAAFEKELTDFDNEYLKDDPSYGNLVSGKIKDIARKKLYVTVGGIAGFSEGLTVTPVTNSLEEKWSLKKENYTAMLNDLRFGSYARGVETIKGGTTNKVFMRASGNLQVIPEDCGTQLGLRRIVLASTAAKLVGRQVKINSQWQLIEDEAAANQFINQYVIVRSPMYCRHPGDRVCQFCVGQRLASNPVGLSNALIEVSSIIMTVAMKYTHGKVLSTTPLNIKTAFS